MRTFLLLPLFILLVSQNQYGQVATGDSSVELVSSKWSKYRQKVRKSDNQKAVSPQAAMIPANRNFERTRRVNDPVGAIDPNTETVDGRSATIDKNMQASRSTKSEFVDGFLYQVKFRNTSAKTIEVLFWEYQFKERANPANAVSHQYLCGVNMKPNREQEFNLFSTSSPSGLISVDSLADKSGNLFEEKILINRVEYADGTIWQRKDWNYKQMKPSIDRALETPWEMETCRNL